MILFRRMSGETGLFVDKKGKIGYDNQDTLKSDSYGKDRCHGFK